MAPTIESSPGLSKASERQKTPFERRFILVDPATVYSGLKGLGMENPTVAEYIQKTLESDDVYVQSGDIFILDTRKKSLKIERNGFIINREKPGTRFILEDFAFDLPEIARNLKVAQTRERTQNQIDWINREYQFGEAVRSGNREEVVRMLKEVPSGLKYPYLINVLVRISETPEGKKQLRRVLMTQSGDHDVRVDFAGDSIVSRYITAVELFGDVSVVVKNGELYFFHPGDEEKQAWFYNEDKRLSISIGDTVRITGTEIAEEFRKTQNDSTKSEKPGTGGKAEKGRKDKKKTEKPGKDKHSAWKSKEEHTPYPSKDKKTPSKDKKMPAKSQDKDPETLFLRKYGEFVIGISKALNIPLNRLLSIIERESQFNDAIDKIDKNKLSVWLMQLTGPAMKDLKFGKPGRWEMFIDQFSKLPESLIESIPSEAVRKAFHETKALNEEGMTKEEKVEFNNRIMADLNRHQKKDPFANLLLGSIFLAGLEERNRQINPKTMFAIVWKDLPAIRSLRMDRLDTLLNSGKTGNVEREEIERQYWVLVRDLANPANSALHQEFDALKRYSGDLRLERDTEGRAAIEHKVYYATVVIIAERLRNEGKKV